MGEDYPKNAAKQSKKWCLKKKCFEIDFITHQKCFSIYYKKITSIWFSDDPITNKNSVQELLNYFNNAV